MATITRENIGFLNDKLIVQVAKDDYLPSFEQTLKKYAKNANIAGFRKGMVPKGIIKKMHGQNVFTEEVLRRVEKELNEFVTKEQLDIFAQPLPLESDARALDMNNPGDYAFAFEIGLKPSFEVDTDHLKVTKYIIEVADESITEEIERLRKRHGNTIDQETISDDANMLTFLVTATNPTEEKNEEKKGQEMTRLLRNFSEAFRPKLMGLKKGESLEATASEAFDEKEKESFEKEFPAQENEDARYTFLIEKIQLLEPASLDEDFFNAVYPEREITTEADFRNAIKLEIEPYYENQALNNIHDQIYHQLIDETKVELPENFLLRCLQEGGEKPKTAEDAEKELPNFKSQLKWSLISTKLVSENNIAVETEDLKEAARKQIMNYLGGQSIDTTWLDDYANRMLKDQKFVEETYLQVQTGKLFSILEQKSNKVEETISFEDFAKKLEGHHH